ncbi:MAG: alanine--tRNA ligase [Candidatus Bipolaricaulota bacterium]|nr:alanine--tRNA ligase [Candidatus Bipolaricaulota bacterium]
MKANELRDLYLNYFAERGHQRLPSSSIVPNDPTLLFASAGMVQFKEIFWGRRRAAFPRATTCQKCFRTTDIENVGVTAYHHTFFEMLGNFSFGDYFKERAIELAWEFLTVELAIPAERLWVSVHKDDDEAYGIWHDRIGIPSERITRLGKEHNWWGPVGDSGPCGPDSEIFYDTGSERACGPDCQGVACDCDRFSEIWNLVFMQYDAQEDGGLAPLENKSIDTGMGLERTAAVLQGVESDFEIDTFIPITKAIEAAMPRAFTAKDRTHRNVIADHIRGVTMLLADGVMPSNEKQGYVLRRILRRAIRAGEKLELPYGTLPQLVEPVVTTLGRAYPEVVAVRDLAERIISREEDTFRKTLRGGERRLQRTLEELTSAGETILPGANAFELYDTYGFPLEMTEEVAAEQGISVDSNGFQEAMAGQRARSRTGIVSTEAALSREGEESPTRFLGYDTLESEGTILAAYPGDEGTTEIILDQTAFYAESGGQVADIGKIENLSQAGSATVLDVRKSPHGAFLHCVKIVEGAFAVGEHCRLIVDESRRKRIARNHTATHLLHAALRQVLGEHVAQAGSYVSDEELRFDFSHFERMSTDEIARVEDLAVAAVLADHPVTTQELSLEEAKATGAIGLFDEEYQGKERVRVVAVGEFSRELCGGTHVSRSGEIGLIQIVSEESVAAGMRRIRALTGDGAIKWLRAQRALLNALREDLGDDPRASLCRLHAELSTLKEQVEAMSETALHVRCDELLATGEQINGITLISDRVDENAEGIKHLADLLEERARPAVIILAGEANGRGIAICKTSPKIDTIDAGALVRSMAKALGGGGGGNRTFAQGGGPQVDNLDQALTDGIATARAALAE